MAEPRNLRLRNLTPRKLLFIDYYIVLQNATQAAIKAGYSAKTARVTGPTLLAEPAVKQRIAEKMAEIAKKNALDADWVIKRLMAIADTTIDDLVVKTEDGLRLKTEQEIDRFKLLAVEHFSNDDQGKSKSQRIRLADKSKALKMLGDYLGKQFIANDTGFDPEASEDGLSRLPELIAIYSKK
jgi:phage terminase small subunit